MQGELNGCKITPRYGDRVRAENTWISTKLWISREKLWINGQNWGKLERLWQKSRKDHPQIWGARVAHLPNIFSLCGIWKILISIPYSPRRGCGQFSSANLPDMGSQPQPSPVLAVRSHPQTLSPLLHSPYYDYC